MDRYRNRELSWLDFNSRVLALAEDDSVPLLERARFLSIWASNLDEFYMVRVAGLKELEAHGAPSTSPDGMEISQQLSTPVPTRHSPAMSPRHWHGQESLWTTTTTSTKRIVRISMPSSESECSRS